MNPPASDFTRYQEIQREIVWLTQQARATGELDEARLGQLWRENEDIKNRHGGMPPEERKTLWT